MISPKDAANAAVSYFRLLIDVRVENLVLEEIELSSDQQTWQVTLGYSFPDFRGFAIPTDPQRHYKIFEIDANTGAVKSMKIRKID